MSKTTTQIVREQYNTILALKEEGYYLKDILEGFKRKNIFPANLTYQLLVNILAKENKLRGIPKGKIQIRDTKKGEVTAAPIPSPAPEIKHTEVTAKDISTPALSTDKTPHTERPINIFGRPAITDEERQLRREQRAIEEEKRRARVQAMMLKEAMEKYSPGSTMPDPKNSAFFIRVPDDADEEFFRNILFPKEIDEE